MRLSTLCFRTVLRRRMRSSLTVVGMAVGIGALVALLGLSGGLEHSWRQMYQERAVDLIVINGTDADYLQSRVPEALLAELRSRPEVREADGGLVDLTSYEGVANTFISGRTPGGFLLGQLQIVAGRSLAPLPARVMRESTPPPAGGQQHDLSRPPPPRDPAEREILIGSAFATGRHKSVGDTVLVEDEPFRVVGVYRAASLFESGGAVVNLEALQRFEMREGELTSIEVRLRRAEDFEGLGRWVTGRYPQLACQRPAEMMEQSFGLEIVQAMAWVVSALALGVGLAGTSNTMLMSVLEQRRQIGILRALGWRKRRILALVLGETLVLCTAAYALGCALGVAATHGLAAVDETRNILQPRIDATVLAEALVCALGLSLLAAAYPAYRATRVSPMEAILLP